MTDPNTTADAEPGAPGAIEPAEPAAPPDAEPDTLAVLARDLRGPVLGNPRQLLTGLLIVMLVVIGLLVGLTALSRQL